MTFSAKARKSRFDAKDVEARSVRKDDKKKIQNHGVTEKYCRDTQSSHQLFLVFSVLFVISSESLWFEFVFTKDTSKQLDRHFARERKLLQRDRQMLGEPRSLLLEPPLVARSFEF